MENKTQTHNEFLSADEVVRLLPIGKSTFLRGVKSGTFPQPVRMTPHRPKWRKAQIDALLAAL